MLPLTARSVKIAGAPRSEISGAVAVLMTLAIITFKHWQLADLDVGGEVLAEDAAGFLV